MDSLTGNLAASTGSGLVGFLQSGTGAVARTMQDKAREIVTPKDFGAVGDGVEDDTANLQAFFNHITANDVKGLCVGSFAVSAPIVFVGSAGSGVEFDASITATAAMDYVIKFQTHSGVRHSGSLRVYGGTSKIYANRLAKDCVILEGCRNVKFDKLVVENARRFGVHVTATGNNTLANLGDIRTHYCGPGISADYELTASYSARSDSGSASNSAQRSVVTVDSVPGELEVNSLVIIDSEPYLVTAFTSSSITVFPWIRSSSLTGTLRYAFGGGLQVSGDDAASVNFDSLDATYCSVAIRSASLYGFSGKRLLTQFNAIGLAVGNNSTSAYYNNNLSNYYTEGNTIDLVKVTQGVIGLSITGANTIALSKTFTLAARDAAREYGFLLTKLASSVVSFGGKIYTAAQNSFGLGGYSATATVTADNGVIHIKGGNTLAITLTLDSAADRVFGHNHVTMIVYGRRTGSRVDSIIITPASGSHTVMGSTSYTIAGVANVMLVAAWFDYEANNWVISSSPMSRAEIGTSIAAAPSYTGQRAVVSGVMYTATGTSAATDWKPSTPTYLTSVAATPAYVGQFAVAAGIGYMAVGTSSSADWKQVTN